MSDGFGPIPPVKWYKRKGLYIGIAVAWGLFIVMGVLGMVLSPPQPTPGIDPKTCEFVLTPKRDETFMRCPVPDGMRIPNWPTKEAPLNKENELNVPHSSNG